LTPAVRHLLRGGAGLAALVLLLGLVYTQVNRVFENLLRDGAQQTALNYAHTVVEHAPELVGLFAGAVPSHELLGELRALRNLGDVFRFKLFTNEGRLLLLSDDLDQSDALAATAARGQSLGDHHPEGERLRAQVLAGGNFMELKKGDGQSQRPALYTEAYVPVQADGRMVGVVEVYVDTTARADRLHQAFVAVAATVGGALLLLALVAGVFLVMRERAKQRVDQRVRYLAEHDALSGALNRASFQRQLQQAVRLHAQDGSGFAVLCIDLDRFKDVNDSHGHATGDEVLRECTRRLKALLRQGDVLARLGGDEFAILQRGVTGGDDMLGLGQRIVEALARPHELAGQRLLCAGSVGAARFGVDAHTVEELLHKADVAMYRAKTEGRGRFSFYDGELDQQLEQRRELTRALRTAVEQRAERASGLALHYQPLHGPDGQTLLGYEALMRWTHPTLGAVSPGRFIPLAEDTGLIEPLGRWALEQACHEATRWPAPLAVSVNLSAAQFRGETDLVEVVAQALAQSGLAPQRLELEITESLLMSDTDAVIAQLTRLSALGVAIAMDDFGTGYSSLAYLWRFPFDKVKIDRAFTQGLQDDQRVALIVRSIVALAHAMGIRVNAEGVETAQQLALLQQMGCDELQGFLLGRPGPPAGLDHSRATAARPAAPAASDTRFGELVSG
jgi:diguanylate cyclase (GGDEF)-like protein